jgi:hypothetical protein
VTLLEGGLAGCNKAIEIQPDYAGGYYCRSLLKQTKGDLDGSNADRKKAVDMNPNVLELFEMNHLKNGTNSN